VTELFKEFDDRKDFICAIVGNYSMTYKQVWDEILSPMVSLDGDKEVFIFSTSGSSGPPKIVYHDAKKFLDRYRVDRAAYITLVTMKPKHMGGIDAILKAMYSGGRIIFPENLQPDTIFNAIELRGVQVVVASPSLLKLLAISGLSEEFNLSSVEIVAYGSEKMPESFLVKVQEMFPNAKLKQTYGITELGTLRTHSKGSDSTWIKIVGNEQTRIVDGVLQIRTDTSFLRYGEGPGPFIEDGWYITGDLVEQDGEYIRILGRASDIINVGGEKVYPPEIEDVISEIPEVVDVLVTGEKNELLGQVVVATVYTTSKDTADLKYSIKDHCKERLEKYKIPVKIYFSDEPLITDRAKKRRKR
jgi:long-chain acyl-CoA synthetase